MTITVKESILTYRQFSIKSFIIYKLVKYRTEILMIKLYNVYFIYENKKESYFVDIYFLLPLTFPFS